MSVVPPPLGLVNAVTYDEVRDRVVGHTFYGTAEFDGQSWSVIPTAVAPDTEGFMAYDVVRGRTVLYRHFRRETWEWDGASWLFQSAASPVLDSIVYHRARGRIMGFGGGTTYAPSGNDLYEWNGATWTVVPTTNNPPRRLVGGNPNTWIAYGWLAYDERRDVLVMYGENRVTGTLGQRLASTWVWDASSGWSHPAAGGPVGGGGIGFDRARGVLTIIHQPTATYTNVWEWDGVGSWTQLGPTSGPSQPILSLLTYDTRRERQLTIFGDTLWSLRATAHAAFDELPGGGCPGAVPWPGLRLTAPWTRAWIHAPWPFSIAAVNLPIGIGILTMGFSASQGPGGLPLPLDLTPVGMPGCSLRVAPDATFLLFGSGGTATFAAALPNTPSLAGLALFLQPFALAPGANAAGLVSGPGYRATVGTH